MGLARDSDPLAEEIGVCGPVVRSCDRLWRHASVTGEPEVGDLDLPALVDEDVVGLEVAVHDPLRMGGGEATAGGKVQLDDLLPSLPFLSFLKSRALDVVHDDVDYAVFITSVMHSHNIRVIEPRKGLSLPEQASMLISVVEARIEI